MWFIRCESQNTYSSILGKVQIIHCIFRAQWTNCSTRPPKQNVLSRCCWLTHRTPFPSISTRDATGPRFPLIHRRKQVNHEGIKTNDKKNKTKYYCISSWHTHACYINYWICDVQVWRKHWPTFKSFIDRFGKGHRLHFSGNQTQNLCSASSKSPLVGLVSLCA